MSDDYILPPSLFEIPKKILDIPYCPIIWRTLNVLKKFHNFDGLLNKHKTGYKKYQAIVSS